MVNLMNILSVVAKDVSTFFYLVPVHQSFASLTEVPNYIENAIPYFIIFIFLEFCYGKYFNRSLYSPKDTVMSISLGMVQQALNFIHS